MLKGKQKPSRSGLEKKLIMNTLLWHKNVQVESNVMVLTLAPTFPMNGTQFSQQWLFLYMNITYTTYLNNTVILRASYFGIKKKHSTFFEISSCMVLIHWDFF